MRYDSFSRLLQTSTPEAPTYRNCSGVRLKDAKGSVKKYAQMGGSYDPEESREWSDALNQKRQAENQAFMVNSPASSEQFLQRQRDRQADLHNQREADR